MYDMTRDEINLRQNKFLLQNWERLKAKEHEVREPINKNGKKTTCISVIETARRLYDSGKTHREIGLLLGMSISSAGRILRMNNHDHEKRRH